MLGAIIGDIVGSQYEWQNNKRKDFTFFTGACHYTDDSLMTLAIAQAFTLRRGRWREPDFQSFVIEKMVEMGRAHQASSWGKSFYNWFMYNPVPYESFGNGAAMRVSPVGWISESEEEVKYFSRLVTEVSHNHPEGIKGAESVAMAIYLARTGASMEEIRTRMIEYYPEIATLKVDKIREYCNVDDGTFITCQRSVPEAIVYLADYIDMSRSFEDCVELRRYFWDAEPERMSEAERKEHLRKTLIRSLDMTVSALIDEGRTVSTDTFEARNSLIIKGI